MSNWVFNKNLIIPSLILNSFLFKNNQNTNIF